MPQNYGIFVRTSKHFGFVWVLSTIVVHLLLVPVQYGNDWCDWMIFVQQQRIKIANKILSSFQCTNRAVQITIFYQNIKKKTFSNLLSFPLIINSMFWLHKFFFYLSVCLFHSIYGKCIISWKKKKIAFTDASICLYVGICIKIAHENF